jgi:hypothetical protein
MHAASALSYFSFLLNTSWDFVIRDRLEHHDIGSLDLAFDDGLVILAHAGCTQ